MHGNAERRSLRDQIGKVDLKSEEDSGSLIQGFQKRVSGSFFLLLFLGAEAAVRPACLVAGIRLGGGYQAWVLAAEVWFANGQGSKVK